MILKLPFHSKSCGNISALIAFITIMYWEHNYN